MFDMYRTSGRTTRMVAAAKEESEKGRPVYVVFASEGQRRFWADVLRDTHVKAETVQTVGAIDWDNLRGSRAHRNCVFFFDHYVLLNRLGQITHLLREMYRWDDRDLASPRALHDLRAAVADDASGIQASLVLNEYYIARTQQNAVDNAQIAAEPIVQSVLEQAHRFYEVEKRKRGVYYPTGWIANTEADADFIKGQEALIAALEYRP